MTGAVFSKVAVSDLAIVAMFSKVVFSDLLTGALFSKVAFSYWSIAVLFSQVVFSDLLTGALFAKVVFEFVDRCSVFSRFSRVNSTNSHSEGSPAMISNGFVDRCNVFEGPADAVLTTPPQSPSKNLLIDLEGPFINRPWVMNSSDLHF